MKPNNICSIFLSGESMEIILFKCALYWAEQGENVWFISPTPYKTLPNGWTKPANKDVLKLIYFFYIFKTKDLLIKLSDIHLLPKLPKVIIIVDINHYLFNTNEDLTNSAYVVSSLLDAASVFVKKFSSSSFIISCSSKITDQKIQTIANLYYSHNLSNISFEEIVGIFNRYS